MKAAKIGSRDKHENIQFAVIQSFFLLTVEHSWHMLGFTLTIVIINWSSNIELSTRNIMSSGLLWLRFQAEWI